MKNTIYHVQRGILLLCFLNLQLVIGCKSPASPEKPPIPPAKPTFQPQYRDVVEFTYTRDSSKVIVSNHQDVPVQIRYFLLDFGGSTYSPEEQLFWYGYNHRIADVDMKKIGKYKFRIILKHVLIHEGAEEEGWWDVEHLIHLHDEAVSPHPIKEKDLTLEGLYDLTIVKGQNSYRGIFTILVFRMQKNI